MTKNPDLINIASLKKLIEDKEELVAIAMPINTSSTQQGWMLSVSSKSQEWIVSTYLSDKTKLYKRADALLKEAKKIGLNSVSFNLKPN